MTVTQGERNTSYQKRWFVLKGNLLFYKDRPADRDLIGVIVVEGCSVQLCDSDEQFAFSLVWSEPGLRTYKLAAEDQDSQVGWIKALHSANHRYLALLVMDLESQHRGERERERGCITVYGFATLFNIDFLTVVFAIRTKCSRLSDCLCFYVGIENCYPAIGSMCECDSISIAVWWLFFPSVFLSSSYRGRERLLQ